MPLKILWTGDNHFKQIFEALDPLTYSKHIFNSETKFESFPNQFCDLKTLIN